jgi:phosphoribosylaminoimidazole-succinocarboxamide synthase
MYVPPQERWNEKSIYFTKGITMGSVKDLKIIKEATTDHMGIGHFHFSDRYSVFDWGEMPDLITDKGKALCIIGAYFFEKLEELGVLTHYRGLVDAGKTAKLSELQKPVDTMEVDLVRVVKPGLEGNRYDYAAYKKETSNFLIPLEVIYRNSLPAGSSVFRRLKEGSLKLDEIGLTQMPEPNDVLSPPILDASTKLEVTDRYLSWQEAQEISGLADDEITEVKNVTSKINDLITQQVSQVGLVNEDGKVEFGYDQNRDLILVDILGTPDECRFTYEGLPVSKEVARIYYRNTDWYLEVEKAKKEDRANWKSLISTPPPNLPARLFELVSFLYQSACNEITGKNWFDSPSLDTILNEMKEHLEK